MLLEKMDDFFTARVDEYDSHMLNDVEGCAEGYRIMAELLPESAVTLLDLGCGTGLELDEIFRIKPNIKVTGIDITQSMLDKLSEKHADKDMILVNASYFDFDFGIAKFDAAVSFQTMHHFSHAEKIKLYKRLCSALKAGGTYIECDYMVTSQKEEDSYYAENARLRSEQGIAAGEIYHYDTPCTIDNQISMLGEAGFCDIRNVWRAGNTTIIIAGKQ